MAPYKQTHEPDDIPAMKFLNVTVSASIYRVVMTTQRSPPARLINPSQAWNLLCHAIRVKVGVTFAKVNSLLVKDHAIF